MSNKDGPKHERRQSPISARKEKKLLVLSDYLSKQESKKTFKLVTKVLQKQESERTEEELTILKNNKEVVKRIQKNKERKIKIEERTQEREDSEEVLQKKCAVLAGYIRRAKRAVVYTGAGISTAASIPDYRGPQGVWTLLQKGESLQPLDLSDAEPTFTHMCIAGLQKQGHVKHVVSQNCDGLHLRSGLPRRVLSEVHGNMYIEVCYRCKPHKEYIRLFDTTENTGVRRHQTGRLCKACGGQLRDTIVHFGEKGGLKSPYRWKEAAKAAEKSDLILCLGSSLKILKCYGCLWLLDRNRDKRPNLVIVNLQWTPKDDAASLKINGRCDDVLDRVMKHLGYTVNPYDREIDPIFRLSTTLTESELDSTSKKVLKRPAALRGLRSSRGSSRTPTPTPSDSGSSTTSSSTDSSDTVDVETDENTLDKESTENEIGHLKTEKSLYKIINEADPYLQKENDGSSELHQCETTGTKAEEKQEVKQEYKSNGDKIEEDKSLIADNLHDYAHKMTPKAETNFCQQNSVHTKESVDTNSLQVYRQLLQLHLLQKQLEWLKSQQRNQPPGQQEFFNGPDHLPACPPQLSAGQNLSFPGPMVSLQRPHTLQGAFIAAPRPAQFSPVSPQDCSQRPSQFVPGQAHIPLGLPLTMQISTGQHQRQHGLSNLMQIAPDSHQISPNGLQISPGGFQVSPPGSHHLLQRPHQLLQGHCIRQPVSTPHPVANSSLLAHDGQIRINNPVGQAHIVRLQMEQMQNQSNIHMHPGMNIQPQNHVKLQGHLLQAEIQRLELERQVKLYEQFQGHKLSDFMLQESMFGNMKYPDNSLNSVCKSHVPNSSESEKFPQTSLNNTIQKCVQNIMDPKQLVLQHQNNTLKQNEIQERQVLEIQKQLEIEQKKLQEKHVNEIHRQLKLEVEKFHEQELMQNILKDLLEKKEETGEMTKDKNNDVVNEQFKAQTSDYSNSYEFPVPNASRCNLSNSHTIGDSDSIFKHPLPYHSSAFKQTDTKKVNSVCVREKLGLPKEYSDKISSTSSSKTEDDSQAYDTDKRSNINKSEIPGFSELVNSLTVCQSCQFLREYGVKKRSCSSCKDLKNTQNVLNTHWMPERQPDLSRSPTKSVSPGKTRIGNAVGRSSIKLNKKSSPQKASRKGGLLSTHTYSEKDLQRTQQYIGYNHIQSMESENVVLGNGIENVLHTNNTLKSDEQDCSDVSDSHVHKKGTNPNEETSFSPKPKFDLGSSEESASYNPVHAKPSTSNVNSGSSIKHGAFTADKHAMSVTMKTNAYEFERDPQSGFDKKSYSDPELCKNVKNRVMKGDNDEIISRQEVTGSRGMKRSHSQSEMDEVPDDTVGNLDVTNNANDSQAVAKKRKLVRCTSVPGWFGKGLNVKKRRKYY